MNRIKWMISAFLTRLFCWEYWPTNLIYGPVGLYWIWLGLRARSFYFLNAANPGIHTGGFVMESKKKVYSLLPQELYPPTVYADKNMEFTELLNRICSENITFPCIVKPDIGMQGLGVKRISSTRELQAYHRNIPIPFLVQSYIAYPKEAGIFYHRMPNEENGKISGIVLKEFVSITGNGMDTVESLVRQNPRYLLYWKTIAHELGDKINKVLTPGEVLQVLHYGNHARGSKFLDGSHLIDSTLEALFNEICTQIPGFYFGRLDIKYNTWEELLDGRNFSVIELNGSGSSPTHMYDPKHSIVFAWKEIVKHWRVTYQIARYNHRHENVPYLSFAEGVQEVRASGKIKKLLSSQNW